MDVSANWTYSETIGFNPFYHGQNGENVAMDIFSGIFVNGRLCILIQISLEDEINTDWALDQVMAPNWRHTLTWNNADPIRRHIYVSLRS